MSLTFGSSRADHESLATAPRASRSARTYPMRIPTAPISSASEARAARRRAARRDEQAVSVWLRELASRPR